MADINPVPATTGPCKSACTPHGENSPAMDDAALAAELAADPAIAASLAEWERTSGPLPGEYSPMPAWDGRGVPAHVSGYHWVRRIDVPGHDMPPVIWTWRADAQVWRWGHREMQPALMAAHMEWLGRVASHSTVERLRSALRECAGDLEDEVKARYGSPPHPVMEGRYERDMETVTMARRLADEHS
jgi:hypothetical protein